MELEQRVQALEQELQILKNQIQVTLLEIQEQLLTNSYPTLRADQNTASQPTPSALPNPAAQTHKVDVPYVNQWGADLEETQVSRPNGFPRKQSSTRTTSKVEDNDWTTRADLERWVRSRIEKLGLAQTCDLIHEYQERGRFSSNVCRSMLEYAEQYDAQLLTEAVKVKQARPAAKPKKNTRKPDPQPETVKHSEEQSVVLRLIAGVANAGAGVTWRKKANG
jgi:hypothetical protein